MGFEPTRAFGKVKEFNGNDESWENYTERMGFYFTANGIDDPGIQKAVLLSSCGPSTYQLLRGLAMPAKPSEKSYQELVKMLKDHLNPKPNTIAERFKFNSRVRKTNETISQFLAELRKLTEHCAYGTTIDEMIRDRLVCGVGDKKIQQKLLSEGADLTLDRAAKIAIAMETAGKDSQEMQHQGSSFSVDKLQEGTYTKDCYRCGGKHNPSSC